MEVFFMTSRSPSLSPQEVRDLLTERFHALHNECDIISQNATYGQALDDIDEFFLIKGKKFIQEVFKQKLQEHVERIDNDNETKHCPNCKKKREADTQEP